ncbi:MAG: YybS family protein [Bacillota bacterium]|nr:YybS family protein [Bacillota bacterium]
MDEAKKNLPAAPPDEAAAVKSARSDGEAAPPCLDDDDYSLPLSARRERERGSYTRDRSGSGDDYLPPSQPPPPPPPPPREWRALPDNDRLDLRAITEGAMMAAIALLLAVIGAYVPLLSILGLLLYPLPFAVLILRRGLKAGVLATFVTFALSVILLTLPQALLMLIQYGLLGIFLGYCFRKQRGALFTLGVSTIIAAVGTLGGLLASLFVSGLGLEAILTQMQLITDQYVAAIVAQPGAAELMIPAGMSVEEFGDYLLEFMQRLLPASLVLSAMLMTFICYSVSSAVLRRLRYHILKLPPLAEWRIDWRLSWGLIAALGAGQLGRLWQLEWLSMIGDNLLYVFGVVLFISGLSFIIWVLRFTRANFFIKLLLIFLLIQFASITIYLLIMLGVFDPLFDLRAKISARAGKK